MSPFFIEFEGFQHKNGSFIFKELCVVDVDHPYDYLYYTFKNYVEWSSLCDKDKITNQYLTNNHHKLDWYEGDSRFCATCIQYFIQQRYPNWRNGIFYTMESQVEGPKVKAIRSHFPDLNVVHYNSTLSKLPLLESNISCPHRAHGEHCAYRKCIRLLKDFTLFD
jgi:hypothetical protein